MVLRCLLRPIRSPMGRSPLALTHVHTLLPRRTCNVVSSRWFLSTRSKLYQQSTAPLPPATNAPEHMAIAELHAKPAVSADPFASLVQQGQYAQALGILYQDVHAASPEERTLFYETVAQRLGPDELYALFRPVLSNGNGSNTVQRIGRSASRFWTREQVLAMLRLCEAGDQVPDERFKMHLFRRLTKAYHETRDLGAMLEGLAAGVATTRLYNMALNACVRADELEHAEQVLERMKDASVQWDMASFAIVMRSQLGKGRVDVATQTLESMVAQGITPSAAVYNTFVQHAAQHGRWRELHQWLDRLGDAQNSTTLRILLKQASKYKNETAMADALERVLQTVRPGRLPDEKNYGMAVSMLLRHKRTHAALELLEPFLRHRHEGGQQQQQRKQQECPSVRIYNMYMQALCQNDDIYEAERVFNTLATQPDFPSPDAFSYTILIQAYVRNSLSADVTKAVFDLYHRMPAPVGPTTRGLLQSMLLQATIKAHSGGDMGPVRALFDQMVKDVERDTGHNCDVRPAYRKGVSQQALYRRMRHYTLTTLYNSMMSGYLVCEYEKQQLTGGHGTLGSFAGALQLLEDAVEKEIKLDIKTLNIWVRSLAKWNGDLDTAEAIIDQFHGLGIEPDERTTWYMASTAYRQRKLGEARKWLRAYEHRKLPITSPQLAELKERIM